MTTLWRPSGAVYGLYAPDNDEIRYVGLTTMMPNRRLRHHVRAALEGKRTPVCAWVRELVDAGVLPRIVVLVESDDVRRDEAAVIRLFRSHGAALLNVNNGGGGLLRGQRTYTMSDETKAKISASLTGKQHTAETRAKMSAARRGRTSPNRGRRYPLVACDRCSAQVAYNWLVRHQAGGCHDAHGA